MTTTLRPSGPLQQADDGTLARSYEVCVNSRPVGTVRVATLPAPGRPLGTISDLRVDEADRGRGRGTVAALAAEEVLRGWRCERIRVSVPVDAHAARRLAGALGYVETGHVLAKDVGPAEGADGAGPAEDTGPTGLTEGAGPAERADPAGPDGPAPGGVEIRAMTDAEAAAWITAEPGRAALLPDGPATGGTLLHVAVRGGTRIGHLWTGWRDLPTGERVPYVWEVAVAEAERGRGHGRRLMRFAERVVRDAGGARLVLRVDPGNAPARALYASLGYRPLLTDLEKTLY
ncbi:GNAT family N-acetyltransferase [Streptomyces fradiae]|uniref:GNAT family N-acetyltransferase n=1 Tax=Streptomyces fradiae TaxID=1906 RepID=UPI0035BE8CFB